RAAESLYATLPQPLPQEFTAMGWLVPDWGHTIPEAFSDRMMTIFEVDKATPTLLDRLVLFYRPSTDKFEFHIIVGGSGPFVASDAAGGMYVVVGNNGTILTSPDGVNWTVRSSGVSQTLNGVAHSGDLWVAVGSSGTVLTSPDGINWTSRNSGVSQALRDITYGGGQHVAVGDSGTVLTSPDGINWTSRNSGTTLTLRGIAYGGGMWVAVSDIGTIRTSPDGVTWTARSSGTTRDLLGITYGGGM